MQATRETYLEGEKRVYYLWLEFLIGRLMRDAVSNLGLTDAMRAALKLPRRRLRRDRRARARRRARQWRPRPARRLLHGEHGDARRARLRLRHPLRLRHVPPGDPRRQAGRAARDLARRTAIRGSSSGREAAYDDRLRRPGRAPRAERRRERARWQPAETVKAVAYDTPIVGWRGDAREHAAALDGATPIDPIRLDAFNAGRPRRRARREQPRRALTRVLYPADTSPAGQELRLRQEYFFSSASLQDILRRHLQQYGDLDIAARQGGDPAQRHASGDRGRRADAAADRRPRLDFDEAWELTQRHFAYTNHTLLPEALETWPVPLFERLLPRHMQIIYEINAACCSRRATPSTR